MNNYLNEIFKEENTVIIPGFGALTMVNRATNELMFMSFMKHNDGTLVNHIASVDNLSKDDALSKVEAFVGEMNAALDSGQSFKIASVGTFTKAADGDILFEASAGGQSETVAAPVVEPQAMEEEVVEELVDATPQEEEMEEVETEIPVSIEEEKIESIEETHIPEEIKESSEEEQWNDDLDMKPLNYKPEKPKQPILEKTKKDKKPRRVSPVLLIFLALIVVGGAMLIGTNYKAIADKIPFLAQKETERPIDKLKSELGVSEEEQTMDTEVDSQEAELIEETTEVDETPVEETKPVVEEKVVKEAPKVVQAGNFTYSKTMPLQIIVGSFGDESNAVRLVEKLNAEGFPAAILGIYGGLHTVSAASFNSMDEIQANSSELQKLGKYWVKK